MSGQRNKKNVAPINSKKKKNSIAIKS